MDIVQRSAVRAEPFIQEALQMRKCQSISVFRQIQRTPLSLADPWHCSSSRNIQRLLRILQQKCRIAVLHDTVDRFKPLIRVMDIVQLAKGVA